MILQIFTQDTLASLIKQEIQLLVLGICNLGLCSDLALTTLLCQALYQQKQY
jgi:hypothetical protein